jgi:antitoxin (DNA-binding transcriptional repressor) of toxin-antitoxin stability system
MKTVTKREALEGFDVLGDMAHGGATVLVTHAGKPWIKLVRASSLKRGKSAAMFKARLNRISSKPIPGAADVLRRLRQ